MQKFRKVILIMLMLSPAFFAACKSKNVQPYITQKDNPWSMNACGAFSMAYYLAETGQISASKIESTAKQLYAKIKFDPSAGFGGYSSPFKILREIAPYADSVYFGMKVSNSESDGEKLMSLFVKGADLSLFEDIPGIDSVLKKNEYIIEIVVPSENVDLDAPMRNPLHYVLTYWKGDVLYTLDPERGKEQPRQNFMDGTTARWNFCNSGIFIVPGKKHR